MSIGRFDIYHSVLVAFLTLPVPVLSSTYDKSATQ